MDRTSKNVLFTFIGLALQRQPSDGFSNGADGGTTGEAGMNRQHVERLLNHYAIPIVCANRLLFDVEGFSPKGLVNLVVEVEYARSGSYLCPVHSVRVVILGQRETNR